MKKRILTAILASMLALTVVGCSSDGGTSETTAAGGNETTASQADGEETTEAVSDEPVELTIATYSDPFEADLVIAQAEAYMEANPNVTLTVEPVSGDIWEVLKTRMAANEEPDIFYMDVFQSGQFIDAGKLAPLDAALSEEDLADFDPALLDAFRGTDGVLYGIPKDFNTLALFYNQDLLDAAGVAVPTTWDELEAAAAALTSDSIYGMSLQNELPRAQPFFYSAGGSMVDENGNPTLNTAENIEGYEFYYGLIDQGYAQTPQQLGVGWNGDAFASGMVAMTIEGHWMVQSLSELAPDMNYGVAPIPYKDEPASMQFTVAYSMSNNTEHPEAAMDVINFLTSTEQQLAVAEAGRSMPSRLSSLETFKTNFPERQVFVDAVSVASPFNYGVISPTVVTEAALAMEKVQLEGMSVADAFNEAQAAIDAALAEQK